MITELLSVGLVALVAAIGVVIGLRLARSL